MTRRPRPALLCILDGWGWRPDDAGQRHRRGAHAQLHPPAGANARMRCWQTSGRAVGLPAGQMGNSEVGHMNIGAGRVVAQDLPRIDVAIEDGTLARRPALLDADRQGESRARARCMSWACCRPAACIRIRITSRRW